MAKHKINIPIKKLMDAMLMADGVDKDKYDKIPEPGS